MIAPKCLSALAKQKPAQLLDRPEPEKRGWWEDYLAWAEYLNSCVIAVTLALLNPRKRLLRENKILSSIFDTSVSPIGWVRYPYA